MPIETPTNLQHDYSPKRDTVGVVSVQPPLPVVIIRLSRLEAHNNVKQSRINHNNIHLTTYYTELTLPSNPTAFSL